MSTPGTFRGVFFADLDGTLLDTESFRAPREALEILDRLRDREIAIVPVSSKTIVELEAHPEILDISWLALLEGGAVEFRHGRQPALSGPGRPVLSGLFAELRDLGFDLRPMSDMCDATIRDLTGLPADRIPAARQRLASEPFTMPGLQPTEMLALEQEIDRRGAAIERGGCFWHLLPKGCSKGQAVRRVLEEELFGVVSGAAGDAWHDLPMLEAVDHGYLLGDKLPAHEVPEGVHHIAIPGPAGLVRAVDAFLAALE